MSTRLVRTLDPTAPDADCAAIRAVERRIREALEGSDLAIGMSALLTILQDAMQKYVKPELRRQLAWEIAESLMGSSVSPGGHA